jgi:hypothetical protein
MNRDETWSEEHYVSTLTALREDFPNYTDNELYAIWCRDHDLIPLDPLDGKVLIDQWQIHAAHDGRHVSEEGFKISRPLYGRALKAEKGVPKPTYTRRKKAEIEADRAGKGGTPSRAGLSEQAMSLALRFDEARRRVDGVRESFRRMEMFRAEMEEAGPAIIGELAATDMETREMLERLGLYGNRD